MTYLTEGFALRLTTVDQQTSSYHFEHSTVSGVSIRWGRNSIYEAPGWPVLSATVVEDTATAYKRARDLAVGYVRVETDRLGILFQGVVTDVEIAPTGKPGRAQIHLRARSHLLDRIALEKIIALPDCGSTGKILQGLQAKSEVNGVLPAFRYPTYSNTDIPTTVSNPTAFHQLTGMEWCEAVVAFPPGCFAVWAPNYASVYGSHYRLYHASDQRHALPSGAVQVDPARWIRDELPSQLYFNTGGKLGTQSRTHRTLWVVGVEGKSPTRVIREYSEPFPYNTGELHVKGHTTDQFYHLVQAQVTAPRIFRVRERDLAPPGQFVQPGLFRPYEQSGATIVLSAPTREVPGVTRFGAIGGTLTLTHRGCEHEMSCIYLETANTDTPWANAARTWATAPATQWSNYRP